MTSANMRLGSQSKADPMLMPMLAAVPPPELLLELLLLELLVEPLPELLLELLVEPLLELLVLELVLPELLLVELELPLEPPPPPQPAIKVIKAKASNATENTLGPDFDSAYGDTMMVSTGSMKVTPYIRVPPIGQLLGASDAGASFSNSAADEAPSVRRRRSG
jgi:hypothetical protein